MAESGAIKARTFANQLVECGDIDWISVTDNAGGNPQLAPIALGKPILYAQVPAHSSSAVGGCSSSAKTDDAGGGWCR